MSRLLDEDRDASGVLTTVDSRWDPRRGVLVTELKGQVDVEAVETWRRRLQAELDRIPDGTSFKLLLDLTGYEPAGLDAHRAMRTVVPDVLIAHGLRPAFLNLLPEAPEPAMKMDRRVVCIAFANVHHDGTKMARYEERIGSASQRFFTSRSEAEVWIGAT